MFDEVTASSLIKVDVDGKPPVDEKPLNMAGFTIHSAVYKARPDIACVMHTHTRAGTALSTLDCGLRPISQDGLGETIPAAFVRMYYLEHACQIEVASRSVSAIPAFIAENVLTEAANRKRTQRARGGFGQLGWQSALRMLERQEVVYKI